MVPPLTEQDRHGTTCFRGARTARDFMLIEFTSLRSLSGRALTRVDGTFRAVDFSSCAATYPRIGICAIVTIDCVGSAGVHRVISELVIYVNRVAFATSCAPINNSSARDPVA